MALPNMKKRRTELGLSLQDLAEACAMTKQSMNGYELGAHHPPMHVLVLIAKALQCSTDYLLGLKDEIA